MTETTFTHLANCSKLHLQPDALNNKVILITGAGRGIGKQVAINAAQHGATTILLSKNKKSLNTLFDEIVAKNYPEPILAPFNFAGATPDDYQELALSIGKQYGRLDGLVINAATMGVKTELIHYDILKWYETIQVNLNSAFLLTKILLPLLKLPEKSSIIFTTANEGLNGQAYQGAYGVTKAAIKNFMEILAAECDTYTNIRVNAINPNKVYAGLYTQNYPNTDPNSLPHPEDIAPLYLHLLSNFSEKIHGQTLTFAPDMTSS